MDNICVQGIWWRVFMLTTKANDVCGDDELWVLGGGDDNKGTQSDSN